jgi:antitoxin VapB
MPLNIRDEEVNRLAADLATQMGVTKTEAVKRALKSQLRLFDKTLPLRERIRPIVDRVMARPATGLEADKAFYDELSGDC